MIGYIVAQSQNQSGVERSCLTVHLWIVRSRGAFTHPKCTTTATKKIDRNWWQIWDKHFDGITSFATHCSKRMTAIIMKFFFDVCIAWASLVHQYVNTNPNRLPYFLCRSRKMSYQCFMSALGKKQFKLPFFVILRTFMHAGTAVTH